MAHGSEHHEVSNLGRIRGLARTVRCGPGQNGKRNIPAAILKPFVNQQTGYLQVVFADRKKHSVHRIVAYAFCDGFSQGLVVNHKNGDKKDNRATNLEWVSQSENNLHSFRCLGRKSPSLGKFGADHHISKPIAMMSIKTGAIEVLASGMDAKRKYSFLDSGGISRCCHGIWKTHKGYKFWFVEKNNQASPK